MTRKVYVLSEYAGTSDETRRDTSIRLYSAWSSPWRIRSTESYANPGRTHTSSLSFLCVDPRPERILKIRTILDCVFLLATCTSFYLRGSKRSIRQVVFFSQFPKEMSIFMYRRPTLYPLEIAVDFLKSP